MLVGLAILLLEEREGQVDGDRVLLPDVAHVGAALRAALAAQWPGLAIESTAAHGLDPDFVEALAFAWLARETLAGRPGNLPEVTGARGARVLGAVHAPGTV